MPLWRPLAPTEGQGRRDPSASPSCSWRARRARPWGWVFSTACCLPRSVPCRARRNPDVQIVQINDPPAHGWTRSWGRNQGRTAASSRHCLSRRGAVCGCSWRSASDPNSGPSHLGRPLRDRQQRLNLSLSSCSEQVHWLLHGSRVNGTAHQPPSPVQDLPPTWAEPGSPAIRSGRMLASDADRRLRSIDRVGALAGSSAHS